MTAPVRMCRTGQNSGYSMSPSVDVASAVVACTSPYRTRVLGSPRVVAGRYVCPPRPPSEVIGGEHGSD